ncbi:pupal cuticle protein Edg-78E-like [Panulirus ornatus]|uniref:pupal cuticle protein Edg-78E-like n=1 Tax=Panulirus ornatus TaxID=150431 RepID=UPI003A8350D1
MGASSAAALPTDDLDDVPLLSTFRQNHHDVSHNPDGTYVFSFSLPQQERAEERDAFGKVTGAFAFVDKTGQEVSVHFDADEDGYHPESDALPQAPHYTDEVAIARDLFLKFYGQRVEFLSEVASDEFESSEESDEDSDESSEESDEDSDEDLDDLKL